LVELDINAGVNHSQQMFQQSVLKNQVMNAFVMVMSLSVKSGLEHTNMHIGMKLLTTTGLSMTGTTVRAIPVTRRISRVLIHYQEKTNLVTVMKIDHNCQMVIFKPLRNTGEVSWLKKLLKKKELEEKLRKKLPEKELQKKRLRERLMRKKKESKKKLKEREEKPLQLLRKRQWKRLRRRDKNVRIRERRKKISVSQRRKLLTKKIKLNPLRKRRRLKKLLIRLHQRKMPRKDKL